MATAHIAFSAAMGGGAPVCASKPASAATLTVSGTAASTTIAADSGQYAIISATDAAMYVVADGSTASAANGFYVASGQTRELGPCALGDTVSAITA